MKEGFWETLPGVGEWWEYNIALYYTLSKRAFEEKWALEVGKALKHRAGFQGAQTGWEGYDDWESKGQRGETGVRKRRSGRWMGDRGGARFSVWDRLSLESNQPSQGFRHTYMHTTTQRALTPLNLMCLFFFFLIFPSFLLSLQHPICRQLKNSLQTNCHFWRHMYSTPN